MAQIYSGCQPLLSLSHILSQRAASAKLRSPPSLSPPVCDTSARAVRNTPDAILHLRLPIAYGLTTFQKETWEYCLVVFVESEAATLAVEERDRLRGEGIARVVLELRPIRTKMNDARLIPYYMFAPATRPTHSEQYQNVSSSLTWYR